MMAVRFGRVALPRLSTDRQAAFYGRPEASCGQKRWAAIEASETAANQGSNPCAGTWACSSTAEHSTDGSAHSTYKVTD